MEIFQSTALTMQPRVFAVNWENDACVLLDQTKLPNEETYLICNQYEEVISAMKSLAVRGAPALGVAGAYGCALAIKQSLSLAVKDRFFFIRKACDLLENARPTAVNLKWAVERVKSKVIETHSEISSQTFLDALREAKNLHEEDIIANRLISTFGSDCLKTKGAVLTCCNTGDLATGGIGTAFGILREGFRQGKVTHVFACETRPVLQGLRLTTWELDKNGIPFTVICDNMVGSLMSEGKISAVITGADRIVANGDCANKIGTYQLAVIAKYHKIPFFIAAPFSTFDLSKKSGKDIPIENRNAEEVLGILGVNRPKFSIPVYNPAFDVTPHTLITAIISEQGIIEFPNESSINMR